MILIKTHFSFFLLAFFLCCFTTTRGGLSEDIRSAKVIMSEKASPSDNQTDHAAFLLIQASHSSLISLGNRQLNGRISKGKFLVASRRIRDPRFKETVILLIQHDINGTVGLIVNRPTTVRLSDFVPEIKERTGDEHFTYIGGPVGMNQVLLLIRLQDKSEGSQWIFDDVYVSASKTVLENLIKNPDGKTKFRVYAGYAGWIGGQLEQEILRGDWQVERADTEAIFKKPSEKVWPDLIRETEAIRIEI